MHLSGGGGRHPFLGFIRPDDLHETHPRRMGKKKHVCEHTKVNKERKKTEKKTTIKY